MSTVAVFGATGALGLDICRLLDQDGLHLIRVGRTSNENVDVSRANPNWVDELSKFGKLDGIVWAQGVNASGTILTTTPEQLAMAFDANVGFIHTTLQELVEADALANPCRTVVLSSIWQQHARSNKFAYMTSKSALSGLVLSAAIDLAEIGVTMNAVLPGVIDTPMTRANLSAEQIRNVEASTLGGHLANSRNIASTVSWLLSPKSEGVNGQFITVDNGWTINRHV
jgi:3-oxoacyl-[acyl-carrier protein] reductase